MSRAYGTTHSSQPAHANHASHRATNLRMGRARMGAVVAHMFFFGRRIDLLVVLLVVLRTLTNERVRAVLRHHLLHLLRHLLAERALLSAEQRCRNN